MLDLRLLAPERVRLLRVAEFERLIEVGVFGEDEHVELLDGVLVTMSPQGGRHVLVTACIHRALLLRLRSRRFVVCSHSSVPISDRSMPEPDLAVLPEPRDWHKHPRDPCLLVEVSDSSLAVDRGIKAPLYAAAGIPEYWIVDVKREQVEVLTRPKDGRYQRHRVLGRGDTLRPVRLRGVAIPVAEILLPPRRTRAKD